MPNIRFRISDFGLRIESDAAALPSAPDAARDAAGVNPQSAIRNPKSIQLGGQALIEGVMMRSPRFVGAAVRRADGTIETRVEAFEPIAKRHRWLGLPLLRGMVGLVEMLALGMKYLNWSSDRALQDSTPSQSASSQSTLSAAPPTAQTAGEEIGAGATMAVVTVPPISTPNPEASDETLSDKSLPLWMFLGTVALSLGLGFCLFVALPNLVADWTLGRWTRHRVPLNVFEGLVKLTIFVAYIWLIGRRGNIRRVFEYHGAEHKVVYAAENGRPLTPESARPFDTPHPRCGTGFALLTMMVSILIFSQLPWTDSHWPRVAMRFVLMPLVAGVSYEILKLTVHPQWRTLAVVVMTPGMWLQRLTTAQPDDAQLEVSCVAMRAVLDAEAKAGSPGDIRVSEAIA